MPNELTVKGTTYDLMTCVKDLTDTLEEYSQIKVNSDNYLYVENQRKQLTSILNNYKRVLSESEEEYLLPYKNLVEPLKSVLDEVLAVEKKLKDEVIAQKKLAFKEKVRKEFYGLCHILCLDGILPDFEEIYDERWYNKTDSEWKNTLLDRINLSVHDNKTTAYIVIETTESKLKLIKKFLYENNITFRLDELKGE